MAMTVESLSDSPNLSLRVKGDLGDLQICEAETSESDDEKTCDKQKVSRTASSLPNNLMKSTVPVFGSVAVSNSENVQFGNNTYFNGPVVIKQIIQNKAGVENASYAQSEDELGATPDGLQQKQANAHHSQQQNSVPMGYNLVNNYSFNKQPILIWKKVMLSLLCATVIGGIIAIIFVVQPKNEAPNRTPSLPDSGTSGTTEIPANSTVVVGYCYENFQVIIIMIILLLITLLLICQSLLTREVSGKPRPRGKKSTVHENWLIKSKLNQDPLIKAPDNLRIVTRVDWLAQPVEGEVDKIVHPVPWVIITHTATGMCYSQSQCVLQARLIQMFHIESRGWSDIAYNFLVGGDGSVYYGRGWDHVGAHTKYYNKYSIGIAFIGTFNSDSPTNQQVEACKKLIHLGVSLGKLAKDYKLLAHRQLISTLSPGDKVYEIIKEWPHFVANVTEANELLPENRRA